MSLWRFVLASLCLPVLVACGEHASPVIPQAEKDRSGMVQLAGGTYLFGPEQGFQVPRPARQVTVGPFWIDAREVSNADFEAFVAATGYETDAERIGNAAVFDPALGAAGEAPWVLVDGADWRHPLGPGSSIENRKEHPVVQVSWTDAQAYAQWRGRRLASDEEWEFAARGGLLGQLYPWGDVLEPAGEFRANYWQGEFPLQNAARDGFMGTAPTGSFAPNGFGLFDMGGNVWEWTAGQAGHLRSVRGGSYLCREQAAAPFHACRGYEVNSRQFKDVSDGNSNVGFRCASD